MTLLTVKPAIEPRKTVRREFLTDIIAVMKNVLSPISETVIISADVKKDEKKLVFVALDDSMVHLLLILLLLHTLYQTKR